MTRPRSAACPVPWGELEAMFLDAGNTLVCMDYALFAERLAAVGIVADPAALERGEAAARPLAARAIGASGSTEAPATFASLMRGMLAGAERHEGRALSDAARERGVEALVALRAERGASQRIWSRVPPEVPRVLASLRERGLRLVVVSNSDGTVEASIRDAGLGDFFCAVIDSHVVGCEKPDPGIFHRALEASGSRPERTLHIGDIYPADVLGARAAGLHAVLLDPYDDWLDADCDRIHDLGALLRMPGEKRR